MMAQGAQGVISIVANVIPEEWKEICASLLAGDFNRGRTLFRQHQALIEAMILETNPQCVKYALSMLGKCASRMRLPLIEPQKETCEKIEQAMCLLAETN
jgi:4-hydroxy-tetrahydrodipicolinate synthase